MSLTTAQIDQIAQQVHRQFPEVQDVRPTVQNQPGAKSVEAAADRFVLTFKGRGQGPGGKSIPRIVRVIADERGKIIKISTSR
jgi:hypothetical protein